MRSARRATTRWTCSGFGLENYDGIGKWRTMDGKFPVDSTGTLPNGKSFATPAEMRAVLKSRLPEFARCLIEKMLTYSLGRGLEPYDRRTVDEIDRKLAGDGLPVPVADLRNRAQPAVPVAARRDGQSAGQQTEGDRAAMITRKALPRRTFLRGMGTAVALPFLDAMVPALRRQPRRRRRRCAWRSSMCRTASTCAAGIPTTRASSASCRAS